VLEDKQIGTHQSVGEEVGRYSPEFWRRIMHVFARILDEEQVATPTVLDEKQR
jgi:hypothetical protein